MKQGHPAAARLPRPPAPAIAPAEEGPLNLSTPPLGLARVGQFLAASREAHQRFYTASAQIDRDGVILREPDEGGRIQAIRSALDARRCAVLADPTFSDPAWALDRALNRGVESDRLLLFYLRFLDRHTHP